MKDLGRSSHRALRFEKPNLKLLIEAKSTVAINSNSHLCCLQLKGNVLAKKWQLNNIADYSKRDPPMPLSEHASV